MATQSLHPESDQGNDDLLIQIAKVYILLQDIHQKGIDHWPEDENPIQLCLDHLQEAAEAIEAKSVEDCMAQAVIAHTDWQNLIHSTGLLDRMEGKAIASARQLILEQ